MSTAWYRPGAVPKIVQAWNITNNSGRGGLCVEIWETTCIVTNFRKADCSILINPANPSLSGVSKFPYFPVRGPEPKLPPNKDAHPIMGHVSQWGGMDVGNGMAFSANVVDGLVHQLGGKALARELESQLANRKRIDEGQAVWTGGVGEYRYLVHTVPPFFSESNDDETNIVLQKCYRNSLQLVSSNPLLNNADEIRVACPLLGAGCRGFSHEEAIFHCVRAIADWTCDPNGASSSQLSGDNGKRINLVFGIPSKEVRSTMIQALDSEYSIAKEASSTDKATTAIR
jgi:O-acetyl-ADP-ribose deacetylase (regulator of RNase III)